MKFILFLVLSFLLITPCLSQKSIDKALKNYNNNSIEYVSVEELKKMNGALLLDTRQKEEFEVSHLKNAFWTGYKEFDIDLLTKKFPEKDTTVVVYCSIGVRSEDIGEKLKKAGYTNIKNLYGGIFEWKNKGNTVYDSTNTETERVHAFSKQWGKLLTKAEKVY